MLRTLYALCFLSLFGLASVNEVKAQKTWTPTAVLTEDDGYPFFTGDVSDGGWTYVETAYDGYTGAAQVSRSANNQSAQRTIRADQATYYVKWTLAGTGAVPPLTIRNVSTAYATNNSGVSAGQDLANVGISIVTSVGASTLGLQPGQTDSHAATAVDESVTADGQQISNSRVHPAGSVSQAGQYFSTYGTFAWKKVVNGGGGGG